MEIRDPVRDIVAILEQGIWRTNHLCADGTQLIGAMPERGENAYLHVVFPALGGREVRTIQEQIGLPFPLELQRLYFHWNGGNLFAGELSLFGLQGRFSRSNADSRQPYSIVNANTLDRPKSVHRRSIIIGYHQRTGDVIVCHDGKIMLLQYGDMKLMREWESLGHFLTSEIERLNLLVKSGRVAKYLEGILPAR